MKIQLVSTDSSLRSRLIDFVVGQDIAFPVNDTGRPVTVMGYALLAENEKEERFCLGSSLLVTLVPPRTFKDGDLIQLKIPMLEKLQSFGAEVPQNGTTLFRFP